MVLIGVFFIFAVLGRGDSLIFLQATASVRLPYDHPVGATFYRLPVLDEKLGIPPQEKLTFHILRSVAFPKKSNSGRGLFIVDEHTGSLMLSPHRKHSISEYKGSTFALDIVAASSKKAADDTRATIVIEITEDNSTLPDCRPREELCFSSSEIHYQIPETTHKDSNLGTLKPIPYSKLCPESNVKYRILSDDKFLMISDNEKLKTRKEFDFEETDYHEWNISCEVHSRNGNGTFYAKLSVYVLDADDNPPYIQNSTITLYELDVSEILPGRPLPVQLTVLDRDSPSINVITVTKIDPLNLFLLRDTVVFHGIHGVHMLVSTALVAKPQFQFPDTTYNVSIIFNDTSLVRKKENGVVIFHVQISNSSLEATETIFIPDEYQVVANVFRHSARHTRIIQPMEVKPHKGYFFRLVRDANQAPPENRIFGVTPKTGVVYIMDEVALSRSATKLFRLELTWRNKDVTDRQCIVLIRVLDSGELSSGCGIEIGHQFSTCAVHGTAEECSTSCGRGANGGFCQWRSHSSSPLLVVDYATCSPHLQTCPDRICDELEEMDPYLCPQDCARNVQGEAIPNRNGRGVGKSAAPCTCGGANFCTCARGFEPSHLVSRSQTKSKKEAPNIKSQPLNLSEDWSGCGTQCITMIVIVSLIVSGLVVVAGILTYRRWTAHPKDEELPSVRTPLNSSTYLVARATTDYPLQPSIVKEAKLEFPRDQLTLEETLGEEGSSASEKRDLVSELNLLKEISHPNVIRLLGATTDDNGQLYIIMEYAEHGSLVTYLRNLKTCQSEVNLLELIAFALQIAKGMDYLASMKVVHRDLAARNVLVASGKILKISDFGLSRDVYEGDTYLKMSKSKVPVKWMALESLENQLYTTKSDVWSFGILLWEIITVGGCPYPGIPTERLFQLLKDAYRMPRPDNCPLQLYEIMKACWLDKPNERPQFKELVQKIELVLEDISHSQATLNVQHRGKKLKSRDEGSVLQQLTSFPKLSIQQLGPYENQHLLSSTEFSV
ncbi:hypothetical protein CDAR_255762 [Caerostris darwini]|uniref:Receptor protein-tyrosine kinase n=1 Tax=Caerostris darwini TaxID=1538125 RepID=A0AAV4VCN9_9ARAC|nr:hypothetical protein CDAR_255762 [Caerostris darwini]